MLLTAMIGVLVPLGCSFTTCRKSNSRKSSWAKMAANGRSVGAENNVASLIRLPNSRSTRVSMRAAKSEWPPISKKLSSGPTESMFSMDAHRAARRVSMSPEGRSAVSLRAAGTLVQRSAVRSTVPSDARGRPSRTMSVVGMR